MRIIWKIHRKMLIFQLCKLYLTCQITFTFIILLICIIYSSIISCFTTLYLLQSYENQSFAVTWLGIRVEYGLKALDMFLLLLACPTCYRRRSCMLADERNALTLEVDCRIQILVFFDLSTLHNPSVKKSSLK